MATLRFYPYKKTGATKIYLRLKIGRSIDLRQSTLLSIEDSKSWNYSIHMPKKNHHKNKSLFKRLTELQIKIEDTLDDIEKSELKSTREINGKWMKDIILLFNNEEPVSNLDLLIEYAQHFTDSLKGKTYTKNGVKYPYKESTISKYQNFKRQLSEYQKNIGKKIYVYDVDEAFLEKFMTYLTIDKGLAVNTKGMFAKRLKTIVKNAELNDIKVNPKYKSIKGFEASTVVTFLNLEEIQQIIDKKMPNKRLQIAKDWFIISCFSAQRISDLFRMTEKNIQTVDGGRYLVFKQYKTNLAIEVPIYFEIESILRRYNNNFPPNLSTNEQSNRSMLSTLIKEVCRISKITEIVRGRYNGKEGDYPKWKLISNHTGRRSFACNLYNDEEWSNAMIMNITGHINERNFYKYIDKEDKTLSRQGRHLFDKMEAKAKERKAKMKVIKSAN